MAKLQAKNTPTPIEWVPPARRKPATASSSSTYTPQPPAQPTQLRIPACFAYRVR